MYIEPKYEIGADYEGSDSRHLQTNEIRTFSNNIASRTFIPECVSFYTDSMKIIDATTNRMLVRSIDYDLLYLDDKASKLSGKEVCGVVHIKNLDVNSVILEYQFVGGEHLSGIHILKQLMRMHPQGVTGTMDFYDIVDLPKVFSPAYHTHHVKDIYASDRLVIAIEHIRVALIRRYLPKLVEAYDKVDDKLSPIRDKISAGVSRYGELIDNIRQRLQIQPGEYILTDEAANPRISRGYGQWVLIEDTILWGGDGLIPIGAGTYIDMGTEQIIRNCYIWKNIENADGVTTAVLTANTTTINEGESITINVRIENGVDKDYKWVVRDAQTHDFLTNRGVVSIVNGVGSFTIRSIEDITTDGARTYTTFLEELPNAGINFTVNDTSVDMGFIISFTDINGSTINQVGEDTLFYLEIRNNNPDNQTYFLDWGESDFTQFNGKVDSFVNNEAVKKIKLKTLKNELSDFIRSIRVALKKRIDDVIGSKNPRNEIKVIDTSNNDRFIIEFLSNGKVVTQARAGDVLTLRVTRKDNKPATNIPVVYETTIPSAELVNFPSSVNFTGNNSVIEIKNIQKTALNNGIMQDRSLTVKILGSQQTIIFKDEYIDPNYRVAWRKDPIGRDIDTIKEGEEVYLCFISQALKGKNIYPSVSFNLVNSFPNSKVNLVKLLDNRLSETLRYAIQGSKVSVHETERELIIAYRFQTIEDDVINLRGVVVTGEYTHSWSATKYNIPYLNIDGLVRDLGRKLEYVYQGFNGNEWVTLSFIEENNPDFTKYRLGVRVTDVIDGDYALVLVFNPERKDDQATLSVDFRVHDQRHVIDLSTEFTYIEFTTIVDTLQEGTEYIDFSIEITGTTIYHSPRFELRNSEFTDPGMLTYIGGFNDILNDVAGNGMLWLTDSGSPLPFPTTVSITDVDNLGGNYDTIISNEIRVGANQSLDGKYALLLFSPINFNPGKEYRLLYKRMTADRNIISTKTLTLRETPPPTFTQVTADDLILKANNSDDIVTYTYRVKMDNLRRGRLTLAIEDTESNTDVVFSETNLQTTHFDINSSTLTYIEFTGETTKLDYPVTIKARRGALRKNPNFKIRHTFLYSNQDGDQPTHVSNVQIRFNGDDNDVDLVANSDGVIEVPDNKFFVPVIRSSTNLTNEKYRLVFDPNNIHVENPSQLIIDGTKVTEQGGVYTSAGGKIGFYDDRTNPGDEYTVYLQNVNTGQLFNDRAKTIRIVPPKVRLKYLGALTGYDITVSKTAYVEEIVHQNPEGVHLGFELDVDDGYSFEDEVLQLVSSDDILIKEIPITMADLSKNNGIIDIFLNDVYRYAFTDEIHVKLINREIRFISNNPIPSEQQTEREYNVRVGGLDLEFNYSDVGDVIHGLKEIGIILSYNASNEEMTLESVDLERIPTGGEEIFLTIDVIGGFYNNWNFQFGVDQPGVGGKQTINSLSQWSIYKP